MFSKHATIKEGSQIEKVLKIYEALRKSYDPKWLQKNIAFQEERQGIIAEMEEGNLVAVAFTWHIGDPYDVVDKRWNYPGEAPNGQYVYLPLLWIREDKRSYGFLVKFLRKLLKSHHMAKRIAFRREKSNRQLRILRFNHGPKNSECSPLTA